MISFYNSQLISLKHTILCLAVELFRSFSEHIINIQLAFTRGESCFGSYSDQLLYILQHLHCNHHYHTSINTIDIIIIDRQTATNQLLLIVAFVTKIH